MDTKLLEDLQAVAETGSLAKASQRRHITHPAFGRRLRQLEAWAGVELLDRRQTPVRLTPAGMALLAESAPLLEGLAHARRQLQLTAQAPSAETGLRIGTGRTLARTLMADWLARMRVPLKGVPVRIVTRSMSEVVALFEQGELDLMGCYEHPALSMPLSTHRFRHLTLARDRLVPVSAASHGQRARHSTRASSSATPLAGAARHPLSPESPTMGYAESLTLGRLLRDHLSRRGGWPPASIVSDSADAIHEFVRRGLGLAWLPWSVVAGDCRQGLLQVLGTASDQIAFDVRLYRPRARGSAALERVWALTDR